MTSMAAANWGLLPNALSPLTHKSKLRFPSTFIVISSKNSIKEDPIDNSRRTERQLAKLAIATAATGALTLGPVLDASAAKSGGRIGGKALLRSAQRSPSPRINRSRTNIHVNPSVAPPLAGGSGFGFGVPYYGGWGWSPFSFMPGPSASVGMGGGFQLVVAFMVFAAVSAVLRGFLGAKDDHHYY